MADIDNIKLRSEKIRQVIGTMPSGIVRYGTVAISLIVTALLVVSYFMPYPENLKVRAVVKPSGNEILISAYIQSSHINLGIFSK